MQPAGAGCLDRRVKTKGIDCFLRPASDLNYARKVGPWPGIQVYDRVIGVFERLDAGVPWIDRDCSELDGVEQSQKVPSHIARLFLAPLGLDDLDSDPNWCRFRRLLLIEAFAVDPVGEPLEYERAVFQGRKNELRDARVVPHDVALGVL